LALGILFVTSEHLLVASLASLGLLIVFSLVITVNLIKGRQVRCNCFGQFGGKYVTWRTLVRNICLILLAAIPALVHSDYLAVHRLLAPTPIVSDEPPVMAVMPWALMWIGTLLGVALIIGMFDTALTIARSRNGPGDELLEIQWLRRKLSIKSANSSQTRILEE
jgi:hypothetical protein